MTQSSVTERSNQAADKNAIRPFRVSFSDAELADMRKRITATRWPEREPVADATQGVQLATIQKLARYWATEHDWRKCEARLNALPHFITEIDGLDIHFIHVRSKHENALPLIVTHGWPGSIIEQLKIVDPLTNPTAHGGSASEAFHLVIPSMPGYGFSGKPTTTGWGPERIARAWADADGAPGIPALRRARRRLGCAHRRHDGCAGTEGTDWHSHQHGRCDSARDRCGGLCRRSAASRPRRRGDGVLQPRRPSSTSMVSAMPWRWRTGRRRCMGSRILRSAWPRGSSITISGPTSSSLACSTASPRA